MGILDDAIRDHLDLKRRHGARADEVRSLEDAAFGSGDRPDPFTAGDLLGESAPPGPSEPGSGELVGPPTPAPARLGDAGDEGPTRLAEPEDSAAPPPAPEAPAPAPGSEEPAPFDFDESGDALRESAEAAAPPAPAEDSPREPSAPAQPPTPAPAAEVPDDALPPAPSGPEESLADLMAEEERAEDGPAQQLEDPAEAPAPPRPPPADRDEPHEPAVEAESPAVEAEPEANAEPEALAEPEPEALAEPELEPEPAPEPHGVPDPPPPPPAGSEPKGRARGRVHHATEEHPAPESPSGEVEHDGPPSSEPLEPAGTSASSVFDFETDAGEAEMPLGEEASAESEAPPSEPPDEFDDLGPPADEPPAPAEDDAYDEAEEPQAGARTAAGYEEGSVEDPSDEHPATEVRPADTDEEDLLAGSPEFIEDSDEDEDLWFEKGPPKDFDFEDER